MNGNQVRNVEYGNTIHTDSVTDCGSDQRVFDREGFELNIADSHWFPRDDHLSIVDGVMFQAGPRLLRRIDRTGSAPFQTTSMIKMCVGKGDGLRAQGLKFADPVCSAVDQNSVVH